MTTLCLALSLTVGIELHLGFEHDDQFGPESFQHETLAVQGILVIRQQSWLLTTCICQVGAGFAS